MTELTPKPESAILFETVLLTGLLVAGFLAVIAQDLRIRRHEISAVRRMIRTSMGMTEEAPDPSPDAQGPTDTPGTGTTAPQHARR